MLKSTASAVRAAATISENYLNILNYSEQITLLTRGRQLYVLVQSSLIVNGERVNVYLQKSNLTDTYEIFNPGHVR